MTYDIKTADFFEEWLQDERFYLSKSTYESYTVYFYKHIIPFFSNCQEYLKDITPRDVKNYLRHIQTSGRLDGKSGGLSHASVKKHISVLKQSLNEAVNNGYINSNPAQTVKIRKDKNHITERALLLSAEEAQKVIDLFFGHRLYPLVVIALYYGLRRSEVLGLKWSAVDFDNNQIHICHTVVKSLTIEAKDSTKTEGSNAIFPLLPEVKAMLIDMKESAPKNSEYIFVWEDGRLYRPDYVTKAFQKHLVKNNFPKMRFHDLRHSTASLLFDKGFQLEDIKNWLRHTDIETTSNIYTHYGRGRKMIVLNGIQGTFSIK